MPLSNRITRLFEIEYPIIQAGMVWASGWKLAGAVSNSGGLGIIGAGSMYPEVLKEHIRSFRANSTKTFAVNLPLLYPEIDKHIETIIKEKVPIVFTSAGNPKTWTGKLKDHGIKVVHVVSSTSFAKKAEAAGCDAVVAEGFEAGGHNGREETTSMVLIPMVRDAVGIPVIAAGGIATGRQMLAAMVLGAEAVQIGTRFVASHEASSHLNFKEAIIRSEEGSTHLSLKKLVPVRLMKNAFFDRINDAEMRGADREELLNLLGRGRAKQGMFEGDLEEGELEIGQVAAMLRDILPAGDILRNIWSEFNVALSSPLKGNLQ